MVHKFSVHMPARPSLPPGLPVACSETILRSTATTAIAYDVQGGFEKMCCTAHACLLAASPRLAATLPCQWLHAGKNKAFGVAASIDNLNLAKVLKAIGVKVLIQPEHWLRMQLGGEGCSGETISVAAVAGITATRKPCLEQPSACRPVEPPSACPCTLIGDLSGLKLVINDVSYSYCVTAMSNTVVTPLTGQVSRAGILAFPHCKDAWHAMALQLVLACTHCGASSLAHLHACFHPACLAALPCGRACGRQLQFVRPA